MEQSKERKIAVKAKNAAQPRKPYVRPDFDKETVFETLTHTCTLASAVPRGPCAVASSNT